MVRIINYGGTMTVLFIARKSWYLLFKMIAGAKRPAHDSQIGLFDIYKTLHH
jgi:hypothetical protein